MQEYTMTREDMDMILDACKPVSVMMIGGTTGPSVQENANNAWERLGKKMGFKYMTVKPNTSGKGDLVFLAEPSY